MIQYTCLDCGDECDIVEETFDYAGTHCTGGKSGIYHTGRFVSSCCFADYLDAEDYDDSTFAHHDGNFSKWD